MTSSRISRRNFIKGSTSAIALASFPSLVLGQTTARLEWQQFIASGKFQLFHDTVRAMRANTNSSSPLSWEYWVNAHVNYCPHGSPYFLAWHRGYLYHFEQQLRKVAGPSLRCPTGTTTSIPAYRPSSLTAPPPTHFMCRVPEAMSIAP